MKRTQRLCKILIISKIDGTTIEKLGNLGNVTYAPNPPKSDLIKLIKHANVVILRSGISLDSEVINSAKELRVIARAGVGLDNINISAAKKNGIIVFNVPGLSARSVAELNLLLMLALNRKLIRANGATKRGLWEKDQLMGNLISGKTVGIIGLGNIGLELAKICTLLGMKVIAAVRAKTPEVLSISNDLDLRICDLRTLLSESDFVTLHVPLTDDTKGMISSEELKLMKRNAFLINTARAEIVDENALRKALLNKQIAGAALDVFHTDSPQLRAIKNVILTPHVGAQTFEVQEQIGATLLSRLKTILEEAR